MTFLVLYRQTGGSPPAQQANAAQDRSRARLAAEFKVLEVGRDML
jgi:hypothetical protein